MGKKMINRISKKMSDNDLHPVRFTNRQIGWIEHIIHQKSCHADTSNYLGGVCQTILCVIKKENSKRSATEV